jgi:hypothetical protein
MPLFGVGSTAMVLCAANFTADQRGVAAVSLTPGAPAGAASLIIEALADLGPIREVSAGYPLSA